MWNFALTYARATCSWADIKKWSVRVGVTYLATLMGALAGPLLRAKFLTAPWLIGCAVLSGSYSFTGWVWAMTSRAVRSAEADLPDPEHDYHTCERCGATTATLRPPRESSGCFGDAADLAQGAPTSISLP